MEQERLRAALARIAEEDPELGARLVLMTLPAAAARLRGPLAYGLEVQGIGGRYVSVGGSGDGAVVEALDGQPVDFTVETDPRTLTELAAGGGALALVMSGRLRVRGKRLKARHLGAMGEASPAMADVVAAGGRIDPDVVFRSLPYLIEPEWTRGHSFTVRYEIEGEGGGSWFIQVRDGERLRVCTEPPEGPVSATARLSLGTYTDVAAKRITPNEAMQNRLIDVDGEFFSITLLGRWIDRSQGDDDEELAREARQREVQERRSGMFAAGAGDGGLLDYRGLYALWERQNWKASDLDFSVDREQWVAAPGAAQENTIWSLGSFYVGEERVTADLAPFLLAAPTGEIEMFLATQLVDEARHAVFFDRFGGEVMALSAEDLRERIREVSQRLLTPWGEVFDDGLRDVANRIKARPDDLDLFVEGITTYHMVVEGFLAVTGQSVIRDYMVEHGMYPGFCEGFGLVERDEHRHVAFGVRFLRDAIAEDPRHRHTVERTVLELAPRAAYVFRPPYAESAREFVTYGYHSSEIYGLAYRALARRMKVLGIELPPAEEFMPGPIEQPTARAA